MARRRKMDPERKAFINSLLEHYQPKDAQDIQDMLKDLLGETLQGMLEAEMDDHLGYSKYDYKNKETDDSRNGYSPKTVTSSMGTIDLDIACTDYTIGFDTAVNTAMEAIDKVRDTSTSHERCSIIEVMGRNAGYLAMWCGIANGAEDVLIPEKYDYDEQKLINNIIASRKAGKKHHIIVNAEGIGHSEAMARRIEAATGIETRATILGHMQRGGNPTCKDRVYASMMGALAVDLLVQGKSCRVVGYRHGEFMDFDINEALAMQKGISDYQWEVCQSLSHNYDKNNK